MSLKAFHIVFILVSIALTVFFASWEVVAYKHSHQGMHLIFAALAVVAGLGLVCYSRYVMRKLKNISYL